MVDVRLFFVFGTLFVQATRLFDGAGISEAYVKKYSGCITEITCPNNSAPFNSCYYLASSFFFFFFSGDYLFMWDSDGIYNYSTHQARPLTRHLSFYPPLVPLHFVFVFKNLFFPFPSCWRTTLFHILSWWLWLFLSVPGMSRIIRCASNLMERSIFVTKSARSCLKSNALLLNTCKQQGDKNGQKFPTIFNGHGEHQRKANI